MILSSSPKKGGFLKSIVSPRKRSPVEEETSRTFIDTPQLPPLDFRTHNDSNQAAAAPVTQINNGNNITTTTTNTTTGTKFVKHKKSNSNISVRSLFGDKSSKHKKQDSRTVLDYGQTAQESKERASPTKSKSGTDFGILKQLGKVNRKPSLKKQKKHEQFAEEDVNKENESPYSTTIPIDPFIPPKTRGPQPPNLQKPLPRLRTSSNVSTVSANPEDEIKLYTPKEYSASGQRNFFDYEVSLKPRPQSVAIGERKASWSSIMSFSGSTSQRKGSDLKEKSPSSSSPPTAGSKSANTSAKNAGKSADVKSPTAVENVEVDIEAAFEALLDARAIPENMRGKLRKLDPKVKADFIKQDKEEAAASNKRESKREEILKTVPQSGRRSASPEKRRPLSVFLKGSNNELAEESPRKKSIETPRPKSRGFHILNKESSSASLKNLISSAKKGSKDDKRPTSSHSNKGLKINTDVSSFAPNQTVQSPASATGEVTGKHPNEFINYLKSVNAQTAELGWLHKLRVILRNERLAWVEAFVEAGGFGDLEKLLYSLLDIEWREEREDNLLHEILLNFKALCTSPAALQKLDESHVILFSRLIDLLFDPERKGPSEFTTRSLVIGLLFTHISTATPAQRHHRTKSVLKILADPAPRESKRPLEFVDKMHIARPYKRWCKEVVDVTKEVFWIFLHHQNIVPFIQVDESKDFATAYHPRERVPVPAAPYVGGVEWDATNYLATHLDLVNAMLCSIPTCAERNQLRLDMRNSGFEKVMGGSLRTASTKFYGAVHDGLKVWVAAAACDMWDSVSAVRCGDFHKPAKPPAKKKKTVQAETPKVELPLAFDFEMKSRAGGPAVDKESALKVDKNGEVDLSWQF